MSLDPANDYSLLAMIIYPHNRPAMRIHPERRLSMPRLS